CGVHTHCHGAIASGSVGPQVEAKEFRQGANVYHRRGGTIRPKDEGEDPICVKNSVQEQQKNEKEALGVAMRCSCLIVLMVAAVAALGQGNPPGENKLQADFRHEGDHIKESCGSFGFKSIGSCAQELVTDHPLHLALGSIAPQNGFGFGPAFVAHYTPNESWR